MHFGFLSVLHTSIYACTVYLGMARLCFVLVDLVTLEMGGDVGSTSDGESGFLEISPVLNYLCVAYCVAFTMHAVTIIPSPVHAQVQGTDSRRQGGRVEQQRVDAARRPAAQNAARGVAGAGRVVDQARPVVAVPGIRAPARVNRVNHPIPSGRAATPSQAVSPTVEQSSFPSIPYSNVPAPSQQTKQFLFAPLPSSPMPFAMPLGMPSPMTPISPLMGNFSYSSFAQSPPPFASLEMAHMWPFLNMKGRVEETLRGLK